MASLFFKFTKIGLVPFSFLIKAFHITCTAIIQKIVVNITISELRPVSNKSPGNFTFNWGIYEF